MRDRYNSCMTDQRLTVYAETPERAARVIANATDEQLDRALAPEWSARTVLAHLRDVEMFSATLRYERMLAEGAPVFADFDEDAWAINRNRGRDSKDEVVHDFALQRAATVAILAGIRPEDWGRTGSHPARGQFTVSTWLDACMEHDAMHMAQLERMVSGGV
jgi:hypothetical protein